MSTLDIAQAEKAADEFWDELMDSLSPEQRGKALAAAMGAFDTSLAEQGCWVPDAFARAAHLERALGEWHDRIEASVTQPDPSQPTH
jgi:hypothetical protein